MRFLLILLTSIFLFTNCEHSSKVETQTTPITHALMPPSGHRLFADQKQLLVTKDTQQLSYRIEDATPSHEDLHFHWQGGHILFTAKLPAQGKGLGAVAQMKHGIDNPKQISIPHLSPKDGYVIGDHSFRSPAFIFANDDIALALIPDLEDISQCYKNGLEIWMDYHHPSQTITITAGNYTVADIHVTYKPEILPYNNQDIKCRVHVIASDRPKHIQNPYGMAARWIWRRWGHRLHKHGGSQLAPFHNYLRHVTRWAFTPEPNGWGDTVWQEFQIDGRECGAPAFIVDVKQHPSILLNQRRWREPRAVWNQAWFSTQRCANGLYRHARRMESPALQERARKMTQVALAAPQKDGLFPSVYTTGAKGWYLPYKNTPGWEKGRWTNSDRRPPNASARAYHILDAAFTAKLLLEWEQMAGGEKEAIKKATSLANRLVEMQFPNGAYPGWVEPSGKVVPTLAQGPETAMGAILLLDLAANSTSANEIRRDTWLQSAQKALQYLQDGPVAAGRWEDFETYFSCSRWGGNQVGKRVKRNGIYKRNTLSMFWCAEAFLKAHEVFGDKHYLTTGRRCLDELSLYQQVWNPPFIPIPCHGGFGVMNLDGEWNDARQSLFAPLYLTYYKATGNTEYFERGVAALRASFAMMYCPENARIKKEYERVHPIFGPESYGFMMENIAHSGPDTEYIGPFTIYSWGNGAALAAVAKIHDLYGDVYIDTKNQQAFGIDGCRAEITNGKIHIHDFFGRKELTITYDNGKRERVSLINAYTSIRLN
ncbi:hypothetical protein GF373_16740 [bacterium]|nr:hypothetical protein [bacterium]